MRAVPEIRITTLNAAAPRSEGASVLYWMIAFRRTKWNFSLDRAIEWARRLRKPIVILEALRCDYPWASDRFHRFVMDGMAEKLRGLSQDNATHYYPYIETVPGKGKGLLQALAARACAIVTDDFPCFFLPRMIQRADLQSSVRFEAVDSNGLFPLRAADKLFSTAFSFRRFLQKNLPAHLPQVPARDPLARLDIPRLKSLAPEVVRRWPPASTAMLESAASLASLPIDHSVPAVAMRGGETAANTALKAFLTGRLDQYSEFRNQPEKTATSGISPYLHFGHISTHQIFCELMRREKWSEEKLALRSTGSRSGWWGVGEPAEEFLDQLITWRELGFNCSSRCANYERYESLPAWAQQTLARHERDERDYTYTLADFAAARTHDPLWNAAQRQLRSEGRIHNYLRMLWGKKILEWSRSPRKALEVMIELNNRFALDGRDPNSYSGIFWCLGRYDRPWGPERPVFGTVRYMSSQNTARKFRVKDYLVKYGK